MKDKLHWIWGFGLTLVTIYAFWGKTTFGAIIPALQSDMGWLVGFLVIITVVILALLFANVIEEIDDPSGESGHH